jgi:hypothetical protein
MILPQLKNTRPALPLSGPRSGAVKELIFLQLHYLNSRCIPANQRSRVIGFTLSGVSTGNIPVLPLATVMMTFRGL